MVAPVWRPNLSKGMGMAPTSHLASCSEVKANTIRKKSSNVSYNYSAQKQKLLRWQWGRVSIQLGTEARSFGGRQL